MPVTPQVPVNGNGISQIHGEHPSRCPAVKQPGIRCVASIRIPDWGEVGSPAISAVAVLLKFMGHIITAVHPLQKSPEFLILKLRKIGHGILSWCDCKTLIGADMGYYFFLESITGFHRPFRSGRRLLIGCNSHICSQTCRVSVQIKLPPAMVTLIPIILLISAVPYPMFLPPWSPHTPGGRGNFCL